MLSIFDVHIVLDTILNNFSLIELLPKRSVCLSWNASIKRILSKRKIQLEALCQTKIFKNEANYSEVSVVDSGDAIPNEKCLFIMKQYKFNSIPQWILNFIQKFLCWRSTWIHEPKLIILLLRNKGAYLISEADIHMLNEFLCSHLPISCSYTYLSDDAYFEKDDDGNDGCYDDDDEIWSNSKYFIEIIFFPDGASVKEFHQCFYSSSPAVYLNEFGNFLNKLSDVKFILFFFNTTSWDKDTNAHEIFKKEMHSLISKQICQSNGTVIEGCLMYCEKDTMQFSICDVYD